MSNLEKDVEALQKELRGTQEMLALVLLVVDQPVVVPKEVLQSGLPEGSQIQIDDDSAKDAFVFSLVVPND